MIEGLPNKAEVVTNEQIELMRNYKMYEVVTGLKLGEDVPEDGWEFTGFNMDTGIVSLMKGDETRDFDVADFLKLNSKE